jgi:hypothetical protein
LLSAFLGLGQFLHDLLQAVQPLLGPLLGLGQFLHPLLSPLLGLGQFLHPLLGPPLGLGQFGQGRLQTGESGLGARLKLPLCLGQFPNSRPEFNEVLPAHRQFLAKIFPECLHHLHHRQLQFRRQALKDGNVTHFSPPAS